MRIIRTSSGVERSRIDVRIVLMQPDLPEPVVPAIRMCGMRARSVHTELPEMSLPSKTESGLAGRGLRPERRPPTPDVGERLGERLGDPRIVVSRGFCGRGLPEERAVGELV